MPTTNKRKNTKLHCQHCAQMRSMMQFLAIDTETKSDDGKPVVLPFNLKRFLDLIQSDQMVKMPRFYAGVCATCGTTTYYQGQNHGSKLQVLNS